MRRTRAGLVLLPVLVLASGCSGAESGDTARPPADLPEDLCAEVAPLVPEELGLGDPTSGRTEQEGSVTATCVMTGADGGRLEVVLTSYALRVEDPEEVRLAHLAACNELLTRDGLEDTRQESQSCSATLPDGSFASLDQDLARQGVLRVQLALPDRSSEQVAAFGTALATGLR